MSAKPHTLAFSRGFAHGNYGNAYESQDWESWSEDQEDEAVVFEGEDGTPEDYRAGLMLGFFSSYELDEIGDEELRMEVERLAAEYGDVRG